MLGNRTWNEWIEQYSASHQHPVNRACHTVGIPAITVAIVLGAVALFKPRFWRVSAALFVAGWVLQFAGHAVEGKAPEFFKDYRFVFVGLRWWCAKMQGKA
jgi:uncharacterized membrane protein YGL010W